MARAFFSSHKKDEMKEHTNIICLLRVNKSELNMSIFCSPFINCSPQGDFVLSISAKQAFALSFITKAELAKIQNYRSCQLACLGNLN